MKTNTTFAFLGVLFMLSSCEDIFENGNLRPDGSTPYVEVNSPANNTSINSNENLKVYITATDKDKVDNIRFTVKGSASEVPLVDFTKAMDKRIAVLDTLVLMKDAAPGTYTLAIEAIDKRTNRTLKEVTVTVRPVK